MTRKSKANRKSKKGANKKQAAAPAQVSSATATELPVVSENDQAVVAAGPPVQQAPVVSQPPLPPSNVAVSVAQQFVRPTVQGAVQGQQFQAAGQQQVTFPCANFDEGLTQAILNYHHADGNDASVSMKQMKSNFSE